MKKQKPNFILKKTKNQSIPFWKILLVLHFYFFHIKNGFLAIGYTKPPLYFKFKTSLANKIGRWFRFLVLITPLIISIRIALEFQPVTWWYVSIAISSVFTLPAFVLFLWDLAYYIKNKAYDASITADSSVFCLYGVPGAGKTSSLFYTMKILADIMWKIIQVEYKLLKPYLNEIPYWPTDAREAAQEIIEAYEFYMKSGTYPCLWSSVPAFVDGVPVNMFTADHMTQKKRLPYGAVVILDEISLILPQALFRTKPDEIMEMCKFPRHFGDFHFGTTEQGQNEMFKGLRSSAAFNRCMVKQRWVLKPRFLLWLYNFAVIHTKRMTRAKATFFRVWYKILKSIGWRKYWYFESGNENEQVKTKTKTFVLPPYLNITYDNRAFQNVYRCKKEKLEESTWNHLRLSKEEYDAIYVEPYKDLTKTKAEKKKEAKEKTRQKKLEEKENQKQK